MNGFLHTRALKRKNTKYNSDSKDFRRAKQEAKMNLEAIIISSTALFLTTIASISPSPASASAYDSHFGIGKSFLVNQNFEMAVKEFSAALKLSPNNPEALVERGTAYNGLKKYDLALRDFGAAVKADPNSYLGYNNRGVTYMRLGDTETAIQNFDRAIVIDNREVFAYLNRAGASLTNGSGGSSSQKISEWLKRDNWKGNYSGHAAILGALGYRQAKQPAQAKALIDEALAKTDRLKWPYPALQFFAGKLNTKELLDEAERSDYDNTQAHCFLALDLRLKGDEKSSLPHLDWILKHGIQNSVEYWIARGLTRPATPKPVTSKPTTSTTPSAGAPSATSAKTNAPVTDQKSGQPKAQKSGTSKSSTTK